ncbi:hypothetical protein [Jiulongibacter sediminis]|jgi:hypothetical protein|uniref:hypothetical protein n=1 Tax=Jiulongibacter sediminis TaxID=1605367 RepID=UPI0026ECC439|nr:hypothetical protein [Jiulongibacter sediminis]
MKKLILPFLLVPGLLLAQKADTLQAKIKDSAEIIIIAKDPSAYDELRKMDINKMVGQMIDNLEKSETRVAFMRDNKGHKYKTEKKAFLSETYFNYNIGLTFGDNAYHSPELSLLQAANSYNNLANAAGSSYFLNVNNRLKNQVISSPYLAFSVNKDLRLIEKEKSRLGVKLSAEPFFTYENLRFDPGSRQNLFGLGGVFKTDASESMPGFNPGFQESRIVDTIAIASYNELNNTYSYKLYNGQDDSQTFTSIPYDVLKAGLNLKLMPKFSVYNTQGKRLFSLAIGPTAGINLIRKSVTKVNNSEAITDPILISGSRPGLGRVGLMAELGVGGISFFGQYVVSNSRYEGNGLQVIREYQDPALLSTYSTDNYFQPYRTYILNFGLKFGK